MANCYQCGRSGAVFRRNVNTGSSSGSWASTRSSGTSTRSYSGIRSLCESCAARTDASNQRSLAILYAIIGAVILYFILK